MQPADEGSAKHATVQKALIHSYPALLSFFRARLPSYLRAQAEDLAQETLLAAWTTLTGLNANEVKELIPYLLGIARHKCNDALREAYREKDLKSDIVSDGFRCRLSVAASESGGVEARLLGRLARSISKLKPIEQSVLHARFFEELGNEEACRQLGILPEEGSRLKYRALEKLRVLLRARKTGRKASRNRHSQ
jgi:RNA polymerase sigma factor (sigma-70 family)